MTTPGPAKPLADLLRGPGPSDYAESGGTGAFLSAVDPTTGANTVTDGAIKYSNLPSRVPYAELSVGRVLLMETESLPVILGRLYTPLIGATPVDPGPAVPVLSGSVSQRSFGFAQSTTTYDLDYWGNGTIGQPGTDVQRIIIVVHGDNRNADDYAGYAHASALAAGHGSSTLVIAPRFRADVDGSTTGKLYWTDESWKDGDQSLNAAWTMSSFGVLDQLITQAVNRTVLPNLTRVIITGHSAGAQYVQRYVLGNRLAGVSGVEFRYVPMNPGTYAYLDNRRYSGATFRTLTSGEVTACPGYNTWKYGLAGLNTWMSSLTVAEIQAKASTTPMWLMLGDQDNDPGDSSLNTSCAGMWQGAHRLERGNNFYAAANTVLGSPATLHKVFVPGVGHDGEVMINSPEARNVFFGAGS